MIQQKDIWWTNRLCNPKPSEEIMMTEPVIELKLLERLREQLQSRLKKYLDLQSETLHLSNREMLGRAVNCIVQDVLNVEDKK